VGILRQCDEHGAKLLLQGGQVLVPAHQCQLRLLKATGTQNLQKPSQTPKTRTKTSKTIPKPRHEAFVVGFGDILVGFCLF
jgi:hypothetical protein